MWFAYFGCFLLAWCICCAFDGFDFVGVCCFGFVVFGVYLFVSATLCWVVLVVCRWLLCGLLLFAGIVCILFAVVLVMLFRCVLFVRLVALWFGFYCTS